MPKARKLILDKERMSEMWNYVLTSIIMKWPKLVDKQHMLYPYNVMVLMMTTLKGVTTLEMVWMTTTHEDKQLLKLVYRIKDEQVVNQVIPYTRPKELGFLIKKWCIYNSLMMVIYLKYLKPHPQVIQVKCLFDWNIWPKVFKLQSVKERNWESSSDCVWLSDKCFVKIQCVLVSSMDKTHTHLKLFLKSLFFK